MCGRSVDHQHVHACRERERELVQEALEASGVQRGHLVEERLSGRGLRGPEEPGVLVAGLDELVRLDPGRGDKAAGVPLVQTEARLVLYEEPDGQEREGDRGIQKARQARRKAGGVTVVFFDAAGVRA